ncbi:Hypothetical protein CINCED_3A004588 [Cinara cedri]|uniref:Uncharacterized protein n=1 Tax=Cinara cedri TaxID=506608 RepID=A0A5E4M1M0_9HEMI|nr:Hypothetical protein CINCED_3A004588 [Cinara cedri]
MGRAIRIGKKTSVQQSGVQGNGSTWDSTDLAGRRTGSGRLGLMRDRLVSLALIEKGPRYTSFIPCVYKGQHDKDDLIKVFRDGASSGFVFTAVAITITDR